jgi:hypothetical protein
MSVLRTLEDKIAGLVEGTFGRVFKAEVKPVELAHKLTKEMDLHRTVSVSRTYVPNRYVVWLSPEDRQRYEGVEDAVIEELCGHLLEHARSEQLVLKAAPEIRFETDNALTLGEFGIQVLPSAAEPQQPAPPRATPASVMGGTMVYSTAARHQEALEETSSQGRGLVLVEGKRFVVPAGGATIGRSRDCDLVLSDTSISRTHAQIVRTGGGWAIRDLRSTNGLRVNGREVGSEPVPVQHGDELEIGTVAARFETG